MISDISDAVEWESETGRSNESTVDWDNQESVALSVVTTVAEVLERDPTELDPLSMSIDTDALSTLFSPTTQGPRKRGNVTFEYEGCLVRVDAGGEIAVTPLEP